MGSLLCDAWIAFRAAREARRRLRPEGMDRYAAIKQAARLTLMSDAELLRCAEQWGSSVCRRELVRRGLPDPNEPPTCA